MNKFYAGQELSDRSICNHECIFTATVIKRTAKRVTLDTDLYGVKTVGIKLDSEAWDRLVTWIDLNAPYHGTWSSMIDSKKVAPVMGRRREMLRKYANRDADYEKPPSVADLGATVKPQKEVKPKNKVLSVKGWPFEVAQAQRRQKYTGTQTEQSFDIGSGLELKMRLIPAGEFLMGGRSKGIHATVDKPFWIGSFEISNEQYAEFDPSHDSRLESRHAYQFGRLGYPLNLPKQPVVRISRAEAEAFCAWLSEKTGKKFKLPTEIQWEYACRAGSDSQFYYGDINTDFSEFANLGDRRLKEYAACTAFKQYSNTRLISDPSVYDDWVPKDDRFDDGSFLASNIGSYEPNAWGLYDMHGNVWEWTDSEMQSAENYKIIRGGSWYDRPQRAGSEYRLSYRPYHRVFNVGFRVICEE